MSKKKIDIDSIPLPRADSIPLPDDNKKSTKKIKQLPGSSLDSELAIPMPKSSPLSTSKKEEPRLIIQSSSDGSRSVTASSENDKKADNDKSDRKQKKKHKEKKHKHKHKHKDKGKDKEKSPHNKRKMLQSKELLQRELMSYRENLKGKESNNSKPGEMSQTIVDELFKDFIANKMNQIEKEYKTSKDSGLENKEDVANSVEEMNRLLDDELNSISQNTIAPSPIKKIDKLPDNAPSPIKKIDRLPDVGKKVEKAKNSSKFVDKTANSSKSLEKESESRKKTNESSKQTQKEKESVKIKENTLDAPKVIKIVEKSVQQNNSKTKSNEQKKLTDNTDEKNLQNIAEQKNLTDIAEKKTLVNMPEQKKSSKWDVKVRKDAGTETSSSGESRKIKESERLLSFSSVEQSETEVSKVESRKNSLEQEITEQIIKPDSFISSDSTDSKTTSEQVKIDIDDQGKAGWIKSPDSVNIDKSKSVKTQMAMAFKISQMSAELIAAGQSEEKTTKKSKGLEDGEVLSSNDEGSGDDDDDEEDLEDDSESDDDDDDPSETGSLSDSDKETNKDGKATKLKKKKRKKKKKKKKKKHKNSKDKDKAKEDTEEKKKNKRKHSSRSRSRTPAKKSKKSYSRSPERRSSRKSRSSSRERHKDKHYDPEFDAYAYSARYRYRDRDRDFRDRDHHRSRDRDRDKWREHRRSRSRDRSRDRSHNRDRDRDRDRKRSRSRSRNRDQERHKDDTDLRLKIDKAKLREIAIKNALAMAKSGDGTVPQMDLATIKAGGKSVEELTNFCKRISSKEKPKRHSDSSSDSESDSSSGKSEEEDDTLIHHPFKIKEMQSAIVMNIRNAKPLPVLSAQEKITQQSQLRLQFPVSSGSTHRIKEHEWVPVTTAPPALSTTPAIETSTAVTVSTVTTTTTTPTIPQTTTVPQTTKTEDGAVFAVPAPPPPPPSLLTSSISTASDTAAALSAASCKPQPKYGVEYPIVPKKPDSIFPEAPTLPLDIGSIIAERVHAVRQLATNPHDLDAMSKIAKAQEKASQWAQSKHLPGQFIGSTGAQILSQEELMGPDKKRQAWVKKDQIAKAAPLRGGIGMALLQKMGWRQGEGLGKNNEGSLEPLALDFKTDRKGLTSVGENKNKKPPNVPLVRDLSGKHPVSALVELCNKRRWGAPGFQIIQESGPDHQKAFQFKVTVNGTEYMPAMASNSKKGAKYNAASVCLQELGLIPRDSPLMS